MSSVETLGWGYPMPVRCLLTAGAPSVSPLREASTPAAIIAVMNRTIEALNPSCAFWLCLTLGISGGLVLMIMLVMLGQIGQPS